jgi:large repetitive protein
MGPYTIGIVLMAVDPPLAPTLVLDSASRTLTSINLKFIPDVDNGGSLITGYLLFRDQGVAGSPFSLVYNGTGKPEVIFFNVTELMTNHYYNFQLYSMNTIYQSETYGAIQVLIGTVPDQPFKPEFIIASLTDLSITIQWSEPSYIGGLPIQKYELWIDDGAGVWPATPIDYVPLTAGSTYQYKFTGLAAGGLYQVKVVAVNLVGSSIPSEVSYFQCADISDAPSAPVLEGTTSTSISVAWNEPASDGGSPISGYKLYMNDILADDEFKLVFDGSNYPSTLTYT